MARIVEVIPQLTDGTLHEFHAAIGNVPLNKRTEPDWREMGDALEAEMARRGISFKPLSW